MAKAMMGQRAAGAEATRHVEMPAKLTSRAFPCLVAPFASGAVLAPRGEISAHERHDA